MKTDNRRFVVVGLLLASALIAIVGGLQGNFLRNSPMVSALFGNWDFVKSVQQDRGVYFRLKVKLAYKGEPQDFDIVASCNARQINYQDGGRTYEAGLTPSVFGRRMNDGKGLVVRPPDACSGKTTENGGVAPDLLPLIVVYEDADTLAFGTAYLTDDAYDSPLSVLKFGGATIEHADRAAFDKFRSEQPNLVKRSSYFTPQGPAALKKYGLSPARIPMGTNCYGYTRFRLSGTEKEHAQELWPAGRPRFWQPFDQDRDAINPVRYGRPVLTDHEDASPVLYDQIVSQLDNEIANRGMPRRHSVAFGRGRQLIAPSYYPDIGGWISLPWPADAPTRSAIILRDGPHVGASIDFRDGALRGFGYCWPTMENFPAGVVYSDPTRPPWFSWVRMPLINFVDGIEVTNPSGGWRPLLIIERDEFAFKPLTISLQSTWGDV
jgi:hypothetical protein